MEPVLLRGRIHMWVNTNSHQLLSAVWTATRTWRETPIIPNRVLESAACRMSLQPNTWRQTNHRFVLCSADIKRKICWRMQRTLMSQRIRKQQTSKPTMLSCKTHNQKLWKTQTINWLINPLITARPGVIVSAESASSSDLTPVCVLTSRNHHDYHQLPWWLYSPQFSVQPRTLPNLLSLTNANTSSYITVVVTRCNGEVWKWVNRHKVQNKPFLLPKEL